MPTANKRPSAQLTEEDVVEIWRRIENIRHGNVAKDSQGKIAADYKVSKKTINRIALRETWGEVTSGIQKKEAERRRGVIKVDTLASVPDHVADLCDSIYAAKTAWGLSYDLPIHWGYYDAWDGKHSVATDGIIIWEDPRLVEFALKVAETKLDDATILASNATELDTFALSSVMTRPVGSDALKIGETAQNGISHLITPEGVVVCIQTKFVALATKHRCEFRQAGDQLDFVYLMKRQSARGEPVLVAAIASMEK